MFILFILFSQIINMNVAMDILFSRQTFSFLHLNAVSSNCHIRLLSPQTSHCTKTACFKIKVFGKQDVRSPTLQTVSLTHTKHMSFDTGNFSPVAVGPGFLSPSGDGEVELSFILLAYRNYLTTFILINS